MYDDAPRGSRGRQSVLFRTGEHGECDDAACVDLLGADDPEAVDVLFVTFTKSARERLDVWKQHAGAPPANVGVVSVDVGGASNARFGGESGPEVRRISDPGDLTGVGIAISEFLVSWSGNGNRTVVCFESLTALLQHVEANRVFQFCNEITSKFEQAGAYAHFHLTPKAHEERVLGVLSSLFDGRLSAADLGYDPEAEPPSETDDAAEKPAEADGRDDVDEDPFEYPVEDPFQYRAGDPFRYGTGGSSDTASDDTDPATAADDSPATEAEPDSPDDTDEEETPAYEGVSDPAALVSLIISGETDPADGPDEEAGEETDGTSPSGETGSDEADDGVRGDTDRDDASDRLQYVGAGSSNTSNFGRSKRDPQAADQRPPRPDMDPDRSEDRASSLRRSSKKALYQRTTATVVGVVVLLVLISFFAAAMPFSMGGDSPGDGAADVEGTPTPEEAAAAGVAGESTATAEPTSTVEPTATATATPQPTESRAPSATD